MSRPWQRPPGWPPATGDEFEPLELHFMRRVLQDAWQEATAAYWLRRAKGFEDAMSRPGDFLGQSTPAERAALNAELTAKADACRKRASLGDVTDLDFEDALLDLATGHLDDTRNEAVA